MTEEDDILYLGKEGQEEERLLSFRQGSYGLDESGRTYWCRVFKASSILKDIIKQMEKDCSRFLTTY